MPGPIPTGPGATPPSSSACSHQYVRHHYLTIVSITMGFSMSNTIISFAMHAMSQPQPTTGDGTFILFK